MNEIPAAKIKMMQASFHCLILGLLGLLPLIGAPFAFAALWFSYSARRLERRFWNPAKPQRILGLLCAIVGALVWSGLDAILIYRAVNSYVNA
jgi:hypothetical protein